MVQERATSVQAPHRPRLLERDEQLEVLDSLLAAAAGGSGSLAFISGEAGAGKTALLHAFLSSATTPRVLMGACDGVSTPTPLGPLHDMAPAMGSEVRQVLNDSAATRQRLFELVFDALRGPGPTVLVIEDLHWSDDATLDLLRFLGRRIATVPALLLTTYREYEVGPFDALRLVIGDMATLDSTHHLTVPALTPGAVRDLVADRPLDPDHLHRLTGGNAFFVSEVLAGTDDAAVPTTVRDAVRARVARLSATGQRALEAASILGSRIEPWLLSAVAGEDALGTDEALKAGILVRQGEMVAFRHELTRLAVLDDVPLIRAIGVHRRALRYLARNGSADPARLAYHAEGAADGAAAAAHASRAGELAFALGAHGEAIAQFRRALRFGDRMSDEDRAATLEAMAYELFLTNRLPEAHEARSRAISLRESMGDTLRAGDDHRYLSRVAWFLGHGEEAWEHGRRAVAMLEPLGRTRELAMAWGNLAHLYMLGQFSEEAREWGQRALALGRELEDPEVIAYALNNIGTTELTDGLEAGRDKLLESLRIAQEHNFQEHVDRALFNLGEVDLARHRYGAAEDHLQACLEYTMSCDLERCQLLVDASRSLSRLSTGRWEEAQRLARVIVEHPRVSPHGRILALCVLARLAFRRGDPEADGLLAEASRLAQGTGEVAKVVPVAATRAEAAWLIGDATGLQAATAGALRLAVERRDPWLAGELAVWLTRAGVALDPVPTVAGPFAPELAGEPLAAAAAWEALDNPYEAAVCRAVSGIEAEMLEAHVALLALGAPVAAAAVARELRAAGASVPRGPRASTRENPANLTEREAEVAALLAEGLTNRQIAERLVVSPKTAGHHVSAVLAKLGVQRRGEVARALAEHRSQQP
jgi:DNA-binding CsgD family transcriptional regulator/tetratricopeptide (TPR) repeat protein